MKRRLYIDYIPEHTAPECEIEVSFTTKEKEMNSRDGSTPQSDEASIEQQVQAAGLTAPRITPAQVDAQIVSETYHVFPGTTLTVCLLTLRNGFHVTGESAAASPENFNEAIGRSIARRNARDKIWSLEGYALRTQLMAVQR